jgi:hypothetical protein
VMSNELMLGCMLVALVCTCEVSEAVAASLRCSNHGLQFPQTGPHAPCVWAEVGPTAAQTTLDFWGCDLRLPPPLCNATVLHCPPRVHSVAKGRGWSLFLAFMANDPSYQVGFQPGRGILGPISPGPLC